MFCKSCGNKLDDDALFCMNCGVKVSDDTSSRYCAHCGNELESDAVFCMGCGKRIHGEQKGLESENNLESVNVKEDSAEIDGQNEEPVTVAESEKAETQKEESEGAKPQNAEPAIVTEPAKSEIKNETVTVPILTETPQKETVEQSELKSNETQDEFFIVEKNSKRFAVVSGGNSDNYYCPNCHNQVNPAANSCAKCGADFYDWGENRTETLSQKESVSQGKPKTEKNDANKGKGTYGILLGVIVFIVLAVIPVITFKLHNQKYDRFKVGDIICSSNGTAIAVIFKAETDDSPALGVALTQSPPLQWASCHYWFEKGYDKTTVAQGYDKTLKGLCDLYDGHDGYRILCNSVSDWKIKGNYPAFEYAENYVAGEFTDWYIPSARELYYLYTNLTAVNHSLEECGAKKIQTMLGSVFYWTCNQDKETSWAAVCTDFQQQIDSNQKIVKGGNQKGGGFIVLPIHQFSYK